MVRSSLLAWCFVTCAALGQAADPPAESYGSKPPRMTEEMTRAMNPGPAHAALASLAGRYTYVTTLSGTASGGAPRASGEAALSVIVGGRFLEMQETGRISGREYSGRRLVGFNNGLGRYEAVWTSSLSTSMMTLVGQSADNGTTIEFEGAFDDGPQSGGRQTIYSTMKILSPESFSIEIRSNRNASDGGSVLTTTYTRVAGEAPKE